MNLKSNNNLFFIFIISVILIISTTGCFQSDGKSSEQNRTTIPTPQSELLKAKLKTGTPEQIKQYTGFIVSFNPDNKTPNYVAWTLSAEMTDGTIPRTDDFWFDQEIIGCPQPTDYKHSGYDRGHMAPAADMKWNKQAMTDCFVMANMCPQDHALNSGAWSTLEKKERLWAKRDSQLIIIAGPIYESTDHQTIGNTGIKIPSAFFKIIAAPYIDSPRAIAFVYPNMHSPGNMQNYSMSVDQVEKITGIDFLYNLDDEIENKIEATSSFKTWNRKK